ncbi:hydantoinase/oxoprolinase family protein [Burkholderia stabilis]|uniref:Acetone carboxylase beta subunit,N-methylhydantoinase A/acetone carboxylase, beta subunit,Hydantoinase/oxoprolinase n=1 Tax=Burkholderia stabilis TaxID=95485 RepID=A0AAJ5NED0_9BURK|nr:hydantoinase/oxoprolinase family protein [Burkholderia stabilis]VBB16589.1 Acetone carboxylase beta subunit,N-methylhydantoinase A/acetone carboxylase, beta subunit,Hydantoinase/oxoprolinase [Burkholderia stabilis]
MRIAVDTGGTFTDLIVEYDDGHLRMAKAPTTPGKPLEGVHAALRVAAQDGGFTVEELLARTSMFIYGTTHALNAVVTGRTARTAFLTTQGHPDILVLREGGRPDVFDYSLSTPAPYIPRSLTWQVSERILANGSVSTPLDEAKLLASIEEMKAARIEAVAVCLLWSNVNNSHEARVGELLAAHLPSVPVSLSHRVSPTIREYRRASATAIDASLKPSMIKHLEGLRNFLREAGLKGRLLVLTSRGGILDMADAAGMPIQMLNSGPAMAPISGRYFASVDEPSEFAIVADTGGTTYDVSLVRRGRIPVTRETHIESPSGSHITGFPSVDIKSVGAGGGSIAWVDDGGMLHVGPQSAGAEPGPAAYDNGGDLPTVTDACVALGYLDPDFFLGGRRKLNVDASVKAIRTHVAEPLGRTVEAAASAIIQIATENMVQAIETITVNQGVDPKDAVLIGGGGAAGLNSAWIARRLGAKSLLIPQLGAALSACGALMSDLTAQYRRTFFTRTDRFDFSGVGHVLDDLNSDCRRFLEQAGTDGATEFLVEARYPDQVWEIEVPVAPDVFTHADGVKVFEAAFHRAHEELFGIQDDTSPVEIVGWCATVSVRVRGASEPCVGHAGDVTQPPQERVRRAYFPDTGYVDTAVHRLGDIGVQHRISGPAIVESPFTTIVVPPGAEASRTPSGSLVMTDVE